MKQLLALMPVIAFMFPGLAQAHTGAGGFAGIMHDLAHSFAGIGLLLAVIALVLWAVRSHFVWSRR